MDPGTDPRTDPRTDPGMDAVLDRIQRWRRAGRSVTVARVVGLRGISGQVGTPLAAVTPGEPTAGTVLSGAVDAHLEPVAAASLRTVTVADDAASGAGMSCGGSAQLLLQPADELPAQLWTLLAEHEPLCIVTELDGARIGRTTVHTRDSIDAAESRHPGVARLFNRGGSESAVLDEGRAAVTALWPTPTLVVVGDGLIADALGATARLLGWRPVIVDDAAGASEAIGRLASCDGVVVLSHSRDVDGPALTAALTGRVGYIGALGARHTQRARAEWLAERGVTDLSRVHGPAGLDLNARTPAEIAIAIVAELLAERSGRSPVSLSGRDGPVHADGLSAPPPRYPVKIAGDDLTA